MITRDTMQSPFDQKLIEAIQHEDPGQIKDLLKEGASPSAYNAYGPALYHATTYQQTEMISLLLGAGADVDTKTSARSETALMNASAIGNLQIMELLIDAGADLNSKNKFGNPPIWFAITSQQRKPVQFLVKHEASIDDINDYPPLHVAVHAGITDLVKKLLNDGTSIETKDMNGYTPLMTACSYDDLTMSSFLITNKANIHASDEYGYTPLLLACWNMRESTKLIELLLSKDANINVHADGGDTPLHFITYGNSEHTLKAAKILIDAGIDVNTKNNFEKTPLLTAAERGNVHAVESLLALGADKNIPDDKGKTPFQAAKKYRTIDRYKKIISLLA